MGLAIDRSNFSQSDFDVFERRLRNNIKAFRLLQQRDGFGEGPYSIGAELEVYIIDPEGYPAPINAQIEEAHHDPHLTVELNRFNLEFDFDPTLTKGEPLSNYVSDMQRKLDALRQTAQGMNAEIVAIGILPTLRQMDFGPHVMTPTPRYQALTDGIKRLRQGAFAIDIDGEDPLNIVSNDITFEGATTSFQLHLRVPPREFVNTYNALQLITPLVLGLGANSPILFGHRLWHETRIALFKQSIDPRRFESSPWREPARVSFGQGWLRESVCELFEEGAYLHKPLLPLIASDDPMAEVKAGRTPSLHEMRLHQGTVWSWNRPVYDHHDDGHVRIEMRTLPAGPTPIDMMANVAFMLGLTASFRDEINTLLPALPFNLAEYNFYRAAQLGINAKILWPDRNKSGLTERPLIDIASDLLGRATDGLGLLDFEDSESVRFINVIRERLLAGQTGATWQLNMLSTSREGNSRTSALEQMLTAYRRESSSGNPVHEWSSTR